MDDVRRNIKERMYQTAMDGNVTMLIYLSKNWCGMSDKQEISVTAHLPETIASVENMVLARQDVPELPME